MEAGKFGAWRGPWSLLPRSTLSLRGRGEMARNRLKVVIFELFFYKALIHSWSQRHHNLIT